MSPKWIPNPVELNLDEAVSCLVHSTEMTSTEQGQALLVHNKHQIIERLRPLS